MSARSERNSPVGLARLISALGVAQIISWGTLFYAIAVLGDAMRDELGISATWLFGAFTVGLLLSGIVSPAVGRLVDARGGRFVLSWGSIVGALSLAILALARDYATLFVGWALAGVAMAACLYDPAFATLHQLTGARYRRAVTALTLFGGFASTVFWPLSQWLLDGVGCPFANLHHGDDGSDADGDAQAGQHRPHPVATQREQRRSRRRPSRRPCSGRP